MKSLTYGEVEEGIMLSLTPLQTSQQTTVPTDSIGSCIWFSPIRKNNLSQRAKHSKREHLVKCLPRSPTTNDCMKNNKHVQIWYDI